MAEAALMTGPRSASGLRAAIEARRVEKRFGHRQVLRGIDLEVPDSGVYALFGPNGAGKSTLLRLVAGLARPTGGELLVLGEDHRRAGPHRPVPGCATGISRTRRPSQITPEMCTAPESPESRFAREAL